MFAIAVKQDLEKQHTLGDVQKSLRLLHLSAAADLWQRWIDEGGIVTSAGISAGMDMALHLVRRLSDQALATKTARQMEYDWSDTA